MPPLSYDACGGGMTPRAGAIILAAGQSRRFGSDKRQATGPWPGPLLQHVVALFRPEFACLGVVIGENDAFGQSVCASLGAEALVNPAAAQGMGGSLAMGVRWLRRQGCACGVIGLADMPGLSPTLIAQVRDAGLASRGLVVAGWQGRLGFPRAIPGDRFTELADHHGPRGAADRFDWSAAQVIDAPDDSVLQDIDTPDDLARWPLSRR